jgi:hypothetical protein
MKMINAAPKASMLIESMRDIGYSLETALADVIDNSITAGARKVEILTSPDDAELKIGILDNGSGMTEAELEDAMRPGSRNPLDSRGSTDLGRFGLGLKTASFSQCRRLSVLTRKDGQLHGAIWDLDFVADEDDWLVQIPDDLSRLPWASRLTGDGTLVVWEKLDRVVEDDGTQRGLSHFARRIDEAREHLELVFHRFIAGERGLPRIEILLNGRALEPFDPFHASHPATIADPLTPEIIKVGEHEVTIQTFTLPHHKKVTPAEWEKYAGRAGYLKNQGFYLYRERRLIIYGTWFGLARQGELTKLARVRIDMPNGLDAEWKIDVKKASAQPPFQVRERLRRIIETIGATSKRVYTSRGRRLVADSRLPVWNRLQDKNDIIYRINREHPVIASFVAGLSPEQNDAFNRLMELVGSALPMDALFADLGGEPDKVSGNVISEETLRSVVATTADRLRQSGILLPEITEMLRITEPFRSNWSATEKLLEALDAGGFDGAVNRQLN